MEIFTQLINKKTEPESKEKLQLLYHKFHKKYTQENQMYSNLKTNYQKQLQIIKEEEEQKNLFYNENKPALIVTSKDDVKFSQHNAEKQNHINEIYEKTVIISKLANDIKTIANNQEKIVESIENHVQNSDTKLIGANVFVEKKSDLDDKKRSNIQQLSIFLIILIIIFGFLLYFLSK